MSGYVLHNSLLHLLLKNGDFLNTDISQGSVATRLGCGGVFVYGFVTNFLLNFTVKEFWKSANIWWSYGQELGVLFFLTHGVFYNLPGISTMQVKQTVAIKLLKPSAVTRAHVVALTYATAICLHDNYHRHVSAQILSTVLSLEITAIKTANKNMASTYDRSWQDTQEALNNM